MRAPLIVLALPILCACSLGGAVAGNADVTGQVIQSSGLPLAHASLVIDCAAGASAKTVPTDSAGRYAVNLSAPGPGRFPCVFAVPDLVTPRIRVDTALGFSPLGQLHPLQIIDLREATTP